VGNRCRRHRPALGLVLDVAVHPVDRSSEDRAQEERRRMVCTKCGAIGADARANWKEQPIRPTVLRYDEPS
jgi:hypothetical protein